MLKLLQSRWTAAWLGSLLYLVVSGYLLISAKLGPPSASSRGGITPLGPSWEFYNPEVDRLIVELNAEKQALTTREQKLNELATRLEAERAEITMVTQAMARMQQDFDRTFDRAMLRIREEETGNLKKLARTYAAMSPNAAATILKQMQEDDIVKILVFMKENEAAPVLENFAKNGDQEARRAAAITERLRTTLARPSTTKP